MPPLRALSDAAPPFRNNHEESGPRRNINMKRNLIIIFGFCAAMTAVLLAQSPGWRDRWVYVSTELDGDAELARVEGIARTASEHGVNGMLLSAGFDSM